MTQASEILNLVPLHSADVDTGDDSVAIASLASGTVKKITVGELLALAGGTQTLAEVLAEGNTADGTTIDIGDAVLDGTFAGAPEFRAAVGASLTIAGGAGAAAAPGQPAVLAGGAGNDGNGNGGTVQVDGSVGDGQGGGVSLTGGPAETDSAKHGGDITLTPGAGDGAGRNGLVFMTLPTSDPLVAGALYTDGAPGAGDPKAVKVSGGPA